MQTDTMMDYTKESCRDFVRRLSTAEPAPGGGGAAALAGAIGAALGGMVGALTDGKKSYASSQPEIRAAMAELEKLQEQLLDMVQADARGFLPLAEAYKLPKDAPGREQIMEAATLTACKAPMEIMELGGKALELVSVMAEKGSKMAASDAGCAAAILKAAINAAALNVLINTKSLKDREAAGEMNGKCFALLDKYEKLAEEIYGTVKAALI